MTSRTPFSGVVPPVVTPRTVSGEVDLAGVEAVVHHLLKGGVHGLFPLGSSGETPYLSTEERTQVLQAVQRANDGRVPVLAGVNEQTTARVIDEASRIADLGVDGLVVTSPYYVLMNDDEVLEHFRMIKRAVDLPLFAYDVPVRTHYKLTPAVLAELAAEGTIQGVKDSSGNDIAFRQLRLLTEGLEGFSLFTGHEVVCDAAMLSGADGLVPGLANVDPAGYVRLYEAARGGDWEAARREQNRLARLFRMVSVPDPGRVSPGAAGLGAFKTALELLGVISSRRMSAPLAAVNDAEGQLIAALLAEAGLLEGAA